VRAGAVLIEVAAALIVVAVLIAILLPILTTARRNAYRERCADNQRRIGEAWLAWIEENDGRLPMVLSQPAWQYGGVRFSPSTSHASLDYDRPISRMIAMGAIAGPATELFECPADRGIRTTVEEGGTAGRTAFRSFGTSYRANAPLLDARLLGITGEPEPLPVARILTAPSRLVLMGDPTWYETYAETGRTADWHGVAGGCNVLLLDGSVRFEVVRPRGIGGTLAFEPRIAGPSWPPQDRPGPRGPAEGIGSERDRGRPDGPLPGSGGPGGLPAILRDALDAGGGLADPPNPVGRDDLGPILPDRGSRSAPPRGVPAGS